MKLVVGTTYISEYSDLAFTINNIYFESDEYYKVNYTLFNRHNCIVYERKGVKLYKSLLEAAKVNPCSVENRIE